MSEQSGYRIPDGMCRYGPFIVYEEGHGTSPNMLVLGRVGSGKSLVGKTVIRRLPFIVDTYGALGRATSGGPVALAPDGGGRVNPLRRPAGDEPPDARPRSGEGNDASDEAAIGDV